MTESMSSSVTDIPCECGYLAQSVTDLDSLIKYDADLNEYYMGHVYPSGAVSKTIIYHCPMCGGVASQSVRHRMFLAVPEEEVRRLQGLIANIAKTDDIEHTLGRPDLDETFVPPPEVGVVQPSTRVPEKGPIRVVTYLRLSEVAQVQFTVFSNREVEGVIAPKRRETA